MSSSQPEQTGNGCLQPLSASLVPLTLPLLSLLVFPGVNTGGVGSYVYEKEPSAVTQP